MEYEQLRGIPNVLKTFAREMGVAMIGRKLEIPEQYGKGYCTGFVFNSQIRMLIMHYELYDDWTIQNPDKHLSSQMILFKFQHIFPTTTPAGQYRSNEPSALITTSAMNTADIIPIHSNTAIVNIEIEVGYLKDLLDPTGHSKVLKSLLKNGQPLLFEQLLDHSLQEVMDDILSTIVDEPFKLFFMKVKAEELVCRLLMELTKRKASGIYPLNRHDVEVVYKVKEMILSDLAIPPVIKNLAESAHMSTTKLKRLFRQIFGESIFRYYQIYRMKEAARLLKEEQLSVSEVGYKMGFTNLSHFTRIFNRHYGINPKSYSRR